MNTQLKVYFNISVLACLAILSACEHAVYMETTVHENGSLDKTIVLETEDTVKNFIGISEQTGWLMKSEAINDTIANNKEKKKRITYSKTFQSAEQANNELAVPNDSLFRISSKFEKSFRWFYTYLYYSDTYLAINKLGYPASDFINKEDYSFIERLPAEGKKITKADSLYLTRLNEKIFDIYGTRVLFEKLFNINEQLIKESGIELRWLDTLQKHKEHIFNTQLDKKDIPDDIIYRAMDSLKIPFPYDKMESRFNELNGELEKVTSFINVSSQGNYTHSINMPWKVIRTNADSVASNTLVWNPPSIKFLLNDYTMYAEARRPNYWAIILSACIIGFTLYLLFAKKSR